MNWTAKGSVGKRRGKMTRLGGEAFMGKNRSKERVFFFFFFLFLSCDLWLCPGCLFNVQ